MNKISIRVVILLLCVIPILAVSTYPSSKPLMKSGSTAYAIDSSTTPTSPLGGTIQKDITYCTKDGEPLKLDIYYPKTVSGPVLTVVYIHGGAWILGDKTEGAGIEDIPALIEAGYAVVTVNYRLAPQCKFPAMIEDVKCAIRFLRANASQYSLATENIGVYGGSAGGHLAALLGVTDKSAGWDSGEYVGYSSRVQAVVDMFGPTNLAGTWPEEAPVNRKDVFVTTNSIYSILRKASPVTWVSPDDPPFLIIHGDKDIVVPLSQSKQLYTRLKKAKVDVTLVVVKNGKHGLWPSKNMEPSRGEISQMIIEFFNQHL